MAVRATPPWEFGDLRAEFGGDTTLSLHDYRRGGGLVPDVPLNANVRTTPPYEMSEWAGATRQVVTINPHTITGTIADPPNPATTGIRFTRGGDIETLSGSVAVPAIAAGEWSLIKTADIGDSYEIRGTQGAGSAPDAGPALGTWWALSSDREWSYTNNAALPLTTITFEIRLTGGATQASALQTFALTL